MTIALSENFMYWYVPCPSQQIKQLHTNFEKLVFSYVRFHSPAQNYSVKIILHYLHTMYFIKT